MKTKILGRTGLEVTIIGLGTIYIGSKLGLWDRQGT